jgi:hypothetical protein
MVGAALGGVEEFPPAVLGQDDTKTTERISAGEISLMGLLKQNE